MGKRQGMVRFAVAALVMSVLASCSATFRNHGYIPNDDDLQNVIVGVDTRDTVASSVGRPGVSGILDDSGWYYVRSRYRNYAWRAPEEIDRQVLAISFDQSDTIANIERFSLADGNIVPLTRRVTDSSVVGKGFLRQLLGNFGNIDPSQLFN